VAKEKNFTLPFNKKTFRSLVDSEGDVLDFGCGYGRICEILDGLGYRKTIGLDISEKMIVRGRKRYPHLDLRVLTPERWIGPSESYDAVVLFAVLTCIPTHTGQTTLLEQIAHVLRPGGILYISDFWLQEDDRNLERYRAFEQKYGSFGVFELPDGAVLRHHDRAWVRSLLSRFDTVAQKDIDVITMNGHRSLGFQYFGRKTKGDINGG
jgi:SAM-dependent methyltransferase